MSKPIESVEIIIRHRRRYTAEEEVRFVEKTVQPGMMVPTVA
jgi:hypothetical protein